MYEIQPLENYYLDIFQDIVWRIQLSQVFLEPENDFAAFFDALLSLST